MTRSLRNRATFGEIDIVQFHLRRPRYKSTRYKKYPYSKNERENGSATG